MTPASTQCSDFTGWLRPNAANTTRTNCIIKVKFSLHHILTHIVQRNHSCTDPIRELIVFHRSSWVRKGGGGRKGREKEEQLREEKRWDGIVGGRRKGRGGDSKGGKEREG